MSDPVSVRILGAISASLKQNVKPALESAESALQLDVALPEDAAQIKPSLIHTDIGFAVFGYIFARRIELEAATVLAGLV